MNEFNFSGDFLPGRSGGEQVPEVPGRRAMPEGLAYAASLNNDWEREPEAGFISAETLYRYWRILLRRWQLIAAVTVSFTVLGLIVSLIMPSIYRASTTLQLTRQSAKVVEVDSMQPESNSATADRDFYETQYALLTSRSLAERIVRVLNLDAPGALTGESDTKGLFVTVFDQIFGNPNEGLSESDLRDSRSRAVDTFLTMIDITPQRNSQLVTASVRARDPELAATLANALAENFISTSLERRYDASSYARSFLQDRLNELKVKLEETEKELVAYAQSESIVSTDDDKSLLSSSLQSLNTALSDVQADRIRKEENWKQAERTDGLGLSQIIDNETMREIRNRLAQLSAEYQQKLKLFKPAFPEMVQLKAQIDELRAQMVAQGDLIKASIRSQFEAALQQENLLREKVEQTKGEFLTMRDRAIRYNILKREVDTNKTLYDGLLQRYKEIGIAGGVGVSNIAVVDRAETPIKRYSPKLLINLAVAAFMGLAFGVGSAFAVELFDDTLKSPDHAEEKIGVPVVGVIPLLPEGENVRAALEDSRSNLAEAYRSLRTALQFSSNAGMPNSLLVTSSQPGEGKTTTSLALAKNFAQLGFRVLLIDGDLRRPSLHKMLGTSNVVGLSNYLAGTAQLAAVIQSPSPNIVFVPCGPVPADPTELLASSRMKNLLNYASKHFDLLILDGPPILELADAPLLATMTEGTLMVVSANYVRHAVVRTRLKRLQRASVRIVGLVLTKFDTRQASSYYYYSGDYAGAYDYASSVEADDKALLASDGSGSTKSAAVTTSPDDNLSASSDDDDTQQGGRPARSV